MNWLVALSGIFAICGALFEWNFFMNHSKARFMISLIGRTGTRIFYGLLGTALTILGTLLALGIIK